MRELRLDTFIPIFFLQTTKAKNIRTVLRSQFELNRDCEDPEKLEDLKGNAIRGIANYITITNSSRDKRLNQVQVEMAQAMIAQKKRMEEEEAAQGKTA
jgi:hypothetical protein